MFYQNRPAWYIRVGHSIANMLFLNGGSSTLSNCMVYIIIILLLWLVGKYDLVLSPDINCKFYSSNITFLLFVALYRLLATDWGFQIWKVSNFYLQIAQVPIWIVLKTEIFNILLHGEIVIGKFFTAWGNCCWGSFCFSCKGKLLLVKLLLWKSVNEEIVDGEIVVGEICCWESCDWGGCAGEITLHHLKHNGH